MRHTGEELHLVFRQRAFGRILRSHLHYVLGMAVCCVSGGGEDDDIDEIGPPRAPPWRKDDNRQKPLRGRRAVDVAFHPQAIFSGLQIVEGYLIALPCLHPVCGRVAIFLEAVIVAVAVERAVVVHGELQRQRVLQMCQTELIGQGDAPRQRRPGARIDILPLYLQRAQQYVRMSFLCLLVCVHEIDSVVAAEHYLAIRCGAGCGLVVYRGVIGRESVVAVVRVLAVVSVDAYDIVLRRGPHVSVTVLGQCLYDDVAALAGCPEVTKPGLSLLYPVHAGIVDAQSARPDPQRPVPVDEQGLNVHIRIGSVAGLLYREPPVCFPVFKDSVGIEHDYAVVCSNEDVSLSVMNDAPHHIIIRCVVKGEMVPDYEPAVFLCQHEHASAVGSHPQTPSVVYDHLVDIVGSPVACNGQQNVLCDFAAVSADAIYPSRFCSDELFS